MQHLVIAAFIALAACTNRTSADASSTGRPRLVVLLVIDQWPEWAFEAKRNELHGGGFDRLLAEGAWHVGRYPSAATLTAPGHALLGTGATSDRTGVIANEWWHRDAGRALASVEAENGAVSPKWLRVAALGDAVAAAQSGARAVSVSLKDRAAILPLGHHGTAIWYHAKTVDWTSNTHPSWLEEWNRTQPIALHLHDVWEPLDRDRIRAISGRRDYNAGEVGEKGFGATFPHAIDGTKHPSQAIFATPLGNELVLDTALAAIDGEHLGDDETPDLLVVSLSAHDYIGHGWGHESWEAWDAELRLDLALARFLESLDRKVGTWAMLVTSDHGASPLPELVGGGRLRYAQLAARANAAAATVLGPGTWIAYVGYPTLYVTDAARARSRVELDCALDQIVAAVRDTPGIERAERTASLAGDCERRPPMDQPLCRAVDPERSGEVVFLPAAGWVLEDDDEPVATSHGSTHDYDQLVPVLELGPERKRHMPATSPDRETEMSAVAGTLAAWLGVTAPRDVAPF